MVVFPKSYLIRFDKQTKNMRILPDTMHFSLTLFHLIPFLQKRLTIMTRYNNRNLLHDCEGKIYPLNHFFEGQRPREV